VIGGTAYLLQLLGANVLDASTMETIAPVTSYLAMVNVAVGLFNLVPGFPLDGGRVLRASVWQITHDRTRATRIAARGGHVVAIGLGLLGGLFLLMGDAFGLWYLVIAYFLYDMASASLQQELLEAAASGVRVADLMTAGFPQVRPDATVADLVRDVFLPYKVRVVPVVDEGRLLGIVRVADVRRIGEDRWPSMRVAEVMSATEGMPSVDPDMPLMTALERAGGSALIPVMRDGALVGMLYPDAIGAFLRTREALGLRRAAPGST
jgi:CBS domain-containing protein